MIIVALVSLAQRTSNITTAAACWEIRTTASGKVSVQELGISLVTAAATVIGIGTPAAIGVTPTSPQTFLREDTADQTAVTTAAVAWGTGPTVPANFLDDGAFPPPSDQASSLPSRKAWLSPYQTPWFSGIS
jgi:hypothetical protein